MTVSPIAAALGANDALANFERARMMRALAAENANPVYSTLGSAAMNTAMLAPLLMAASQAAPVGMLSKLLPMAPMLAPAMAHAGGATGDWPPNGYGCGGLSGRFDNRCEEARRYWEQKLEEKQREPRKSNRQPSGYPRSLHVGN
jgi:hypothetical protein